MASHRQLIHAIGLSDGASDDLKQIVLYPSLPQNKVRMMGYALQEPRRDLVIFLGFVLGVKRFRLRP